MDKTENTSNTAPFLNSEGYRHRLQLIYEATGDGMWEWDLVNRILYWDDQCYRMLGYEPQEFKIDSDAVMERLLHPLDIVDVLSQIEKAIATNTFFQIEYRLQQKDGAYCWLKSRGKVIETNSQGVATKMLGLNQDINQRVLTSLELKKEKIQLSSFVKYAPAAIAMLDQDMRYLVASQNWYNMYKLKEVDIIGKCHYDIFPNIGEDWKIIHKRCLTTGISEKNDMDCWRPEGWDRDLFIRWEVRPWFLDPGEIGGLIFVTEDITERVYREKELERLRIESESANRAKTEFLSKMSHELRTPMNSIIGLSRILSETHLGSEQTAYLKSIEKSGESLLSLINDILDFSIIQSHPMDIRSYPIDLHHIEKRIHFLASHRIAEKKLGFHWNYLTPMPQGILGDAPRLEQILLNLVGNAIKFTNQGSITVNVSAPEVGGGYCILKWEVIDTGIGIEEAHHKDIFQPFFQVDSSNTRSYGGTGLGLVISKQIVKNMGGNISFFTQMGKGTRFWFTTKHRLQENESPSRAGSEGIPKPHKELLIGKILLVEDNEANQFVTKTILQRFGHSIDIADNGQIGLDMLQEFDYDIILMDCQMPVMDGYEATKQIRSGRCGEQKANIPIVAVTANAMVGDKEICLNAGMSDYLSKPVEPKALVDIIQKWLHRP